MSDTLTLSRPVSRASPIANRASKKPPQTIETSGQRCSDLLARSCPNGSLVRMCRALMESSTWHSTECSLIWKALATRQLRLKFQLAPSTRRTSEKDCSLWPTAQARDGDQRGMQPKRYLNPDRSSDLPDAVAFAVWPTARASDHKSGKSSVTHNSRPLTEVATWATVRCQDSHGSGYQIDPRSGRQVLTLTGQTRNGSPAPTEKQGALNPEFVCWLMGFPAEWTASGRTVTPSSRKSRSASPKQSSQQKGK